MFPGVVGPIEIAAGPEIGGEIEPVRITRRDRNPHSAEAVLFPCWKPAGQLAPGGPAVGGFVESGARAVEGAVFPGGLPGFPERGVDDVGILRIEDHVDRTGVLVLVEHLAEGGAPVGGEKQAPLFVGPVGVALDGHEQPIGIARVDRDLRNLLAVAEAEVFPGPSPIGGAVDPVAGGEVGPLETFAAPDVDDVGVGRRHGDGADRSGRLIVEDRVPGPAVVGGLEDAAVYGADVEDVGPVGHTDGGLGPAAPMGADAAPLEGAEQGGVDLLSRQRSRGRHGGEEQSGGEHAWHPDHGSGLGGERGKSIIQ